MGMTEDVKRQAGVGARALREVWHVSAHGRSLDRVCDSLDTGKSVCDDLLNQLGGEWVVVEDWANLNTPESPDRWVRHVSRGTSGPVEQSVAAMRVDTSGTWFRESTPAYRADALAPRRGRAGIEVTLTGLLLARIAEDEEVARAYRGPSWWSESFLNGAILSHPHVDDVAPGVAESVSRGAAHIARHDPARVLAECEARRRIVDEHWPYDDTGTCNVCTDIARGIPSPCPTLRLLALPYTDHPDYREEWRA